MKKELKVNVDAKLLEEITKISKDYGIPMDSLVNRILMWYMDAARQFNK